MRVKTIILNVIYRPHHGNFSLFCRSWKSYPREWNKRSWCNLLGWFNIWVDDIRNSDAQNFLRLLNDFCLVNFVNKPTYNSGHILYLVITKNHHSIVKSLTADTIHNLSDHMNVNFHLNFNYVKGERKHIMFKNKNSIFPDNLREELDEKYSITQNDRVHTELFPCVKCVTTSFKLFTREA